MYLADNDIIINLYCSMTFCISFVDLSVPTIILLTFNFNFVASSTYIDVLIVIFGDDSVAMITYLNIIDRKIITSFSFFENIRGKTFMLICTFYNKLGFEYFSLKITKYHY